MSKRQKLFLKYFFGFYFFFFSYYIQHCFICRHSDSTVPTDAGIEPRTLQLVHWQSDALTTRLDIISHLIKRQKLLAAMFSKIVFGNKKTSATK
jgi:hypothetical protein